MTALRRIVVALALGVMVGALLAAPASGAPPGTYAATADGAGLSLALTQPGGAEGLAADLGITHAELDSTPVASGSGAGILQAPETVAETSAPPDDSQEASLADQSFGNEQLGELAFELARGTSASAATGDPSSINRGEVVGAEIVFAPGGVAALGTPPFAVTSDAAVAVDGDLVTAEADSEEANIPVQLTPDLVDPVCDLLGQIDPGLGEACEEAVGEGGELITVATVSILPAVVSCAYDGTTGLASVPTAQAATLEIQIFEEPPVTVSPGQTVDLLAGTPLQIHAVVGDAATNVSGGEASATASGLSIDMFVDPMPQLHIGASESSCAISGLLPAATTTPPPPTTEPPLPQTGAPLNLIYLGGGILVALALALALVMRRA